MATPKSLTGVIRLPDAHLHFYLSFDEKAPKTGVEGGELKSIGRILMQAEKLSPEMQEVLVKFAEFLEVDLTK